MREDAELELGGALARLGELGAALAVARLVLRDRALQREQARLLHVALLEQPLVRRQLVLLQLERALLGARSARRAPSPPPPVSRICLRSTAIWLSSASRRARNSAVSRRSRRPCSPALQQVGRKRRLRRERALGLQPRRLGALGIELGAQQVERARRRARRRARTSSWPWLTRSPSRTRICSHDAAFLVLHHLAVEVDLDEARRDDRAGERRRRPPRRRGHERAADDQQPGAHDAADSMVSARARSCGAPRGATCA